MTVEKEDLVHVYDTISLKDTTIKITRGRFPNNAIHPEYVEIHQLEGKFSDLTEFDQHADSDMEIRNYMCMSPEDAVELYRTLRLILGMPS